MKKIKKYIFVDSSAQITTENFKNILSYHKTVCFDCSYSEKKTLNSLLSFVANKSYKNELN